MTSPAGRTASAPPSPAHGGRPHARQPSRRGSAGGWTEGEAHTDLPIALALLFMAMEELDGEHATQPSPNPQRSHVALRHLLSIISASRARARRVAEQERLEEVERRRCDALYEGGIERRGQFQKFVEEYAQHKEAEELRGCSFTPIISPHARRLQREPEDFAQRCQSWKVAAEQRLVEKYRSEHSFTPKIVRRARATTSISISSTPASRLLDELDGGHDNNKAPTSCELGSAVKPHGGAASETSPTSSRRHRGAATDLHQAVDATHAFRPLITTTARKTDRFFQQLRQEVEEHSSRADTSEAAMDGFLTPVHPDFLATAAKAVMVDDDDDDAELDHPPQRHTAAPHHLLLATTPPAPSPSMQRHLDRVAEDLQRRAAATPKLRPTHAAGPGGAVLCLRTSAQGAGDGARAACGKDLFDAQTGQLLFSPEALPSMYRDGALVPFNQLNRKERATLLDSLMAKGQHMAVMRIHRFLQRQHQTHAQGQRSQSASPAHGGEVVARLATRRTPRRQLPSSRVEEEPCTFQPSISPRSAELAERWRKRSHEKKAPAAPQSSTTPQAEMLRARTSSAAASRSMIARGEVWLQRKEVRHSRAVEQKQEEELRDCFFAPQRAAVHGAVPMEHVNAMADASTLRLVNELQKLRNMAVHRDPAAPQITNHHHHHQLAPTHSTSPRRRAAIAADSAAVSTPRLKWGSTESSPQPQPQPRRAHSAAVGRGGGVPKALFPSTSQMSIYADSRWSVENPWAAVDAYSDVFLCRTPMKEV